MNDKEGDKLTSTGGVDESYLRQQGAAPPAQMNSKDGDILLSIEKSDGSFLSKTDGVEDEKPDLDLEHKVTVKEASVASKTLELPTKRKLIFGEAMTPELARERGTLNSVQKKRKKDNDDSARKRRSTLSGESCLKDLTRESSDNCQRPLSAFQRLMDPKVRSASTPPLKRRGEKKRVAATPARQLTGQKNIIQMLSVKAAVLGEGEESLRGNEGGEGSEPQDVIKPDNKDTA